MLASVVECVNDLYRANTGNVDARQRHNILSLWRAFWLPSNSDTINFNGFWVKCADRRHTLNIIREVFGDDTYYFKHNGISPVIVDAGANIGVSALYFKSLYPDARITCFEPARITYDLLASNIYFNALSNVKAVKVALSNREGETRFYYKPGRDGGSSTFENDGVVETVKLARLSKYITGPVDLLKLDAEGSELLIIEDLAESKKLWNIREIIGEYHNYILGDAGLFKIVDTLKQYGFKSVLFRPTERQNPNLGVGPEYCTLFYARRA